MSGASIQHRSTETTRRAVRPTPHRIAARGRFVAAPAWTAMLVIGLTLAGCKSKNAAAPASTQPAAKPAEQRAERGPVRLTVRLDQDRVTIAEPFELTIEARAEPDVDVTLPQFGTTLLEFAVRDFREQTPKPADTARIWRQTYTLDSFVSGTFELPGIEVRFTDRRPRPAAATTQPVESAVKTEPLTINVESLLAGQFDPQKFNDIKGPVDLPAPRSYRLALWAIGLFVAFAALAALAWYLRRRRRPEETVRMPPHQWALMELERLLAEDLIGRGQITEFYYRLNGLLRRYIELRFGLHAAEQTSEEFIRALQTDARLPSEHKETLREFVAACDPVKYARYRPDASEIEAVFNAARDFIVQTQQREQEVELAGAETAA